MTLAGKAEEATRRSAAKLLKAALLLLTSVLVLIGPLATLGSNTTNGQGPTVPSLIEGRDGSSAVARQSVAYALHVDTQGRGSVARKPDQTLYTAGATLELTALPEPGWTFDRWSGDLSGTGNPKTITMDVNKSVTAHFTALWGHPEPSIAVADRETRLSVGETDWLTLTVTNHGAEKASGWGVQVKVSNGLSLVEALSHPWDDVLCEGSTARWTVEAPLIPGGSASVYVGIQRHSVVGTEDVSYTAWMEDGDGLPEPTQYAHAYWGNSCDRGYANYELGGGGDLTTKEQRAEAIRDAVQRLHEAFDLPPDLPSDQEQAIILSIAAQECGGHEFDNEIVSRDWGRGVMQITYPDAYVGAGNAGPCDPGTDCHLCRRGGELWRLCRSSPTYCAQYDEIKTQALAACSAYYGNTQEGIDRNIGDGLYVLQDKKRAGEPDSLQNVLLPSGHEVLPEELHWMIVASRYGPNFTRYGEGPFFYVRLLGEILAYDLNDHYGSDQPNLPELGAKFIGACARRAELDGTANLQVWDDESRVTGETEEGAREEIPNSEYWPSLRRANLFLPDQAHRYRVVGTDSSSYDLTILSGCERLSALSAETSAGLASLSLQNVPITAQRVHEYVVDWTSTGPTATRKNDLDGDGEFDWTVTIQPPTAALTSSLHGNIVTVDASGSSDPDGQKLSYIWDFGDGRSYIGDAIERHAYNTVGTYVVELTVRDAHGAVDSASVTVRVSITPSIYLPFVAKESSGTLP